MAILDSFGRNVVEKLDWFAIRYYFASALAVATGITATGLISYWWFRGRAWAFQPGHILLMVVGVGELLTLVAIGIDNAVLGEDPGQAPIRVRIYLAMGVCQHVLMVLIPALALYLVRLTRVWQFVLGLVIFQNLLMLVMINPAELPITQFISFEVLSGSSRVTRYVVPAAIFLCTAWDLLWRERRDWLHWVGIIVVLVYYTAWMNPMAWF